MRTFRKTLFVLSVLTGSDLLAGALRLEVEDSATNPEAKAQQAVLVARTTACQAPEKTRVVATAEGIVDGNHRTISLRVIQLSTPGVFAVTREWPAGGNWAVKLVATNPEYKDYATGVLVRMEQDGFDWAGVKHFYHAPTPAEVDAVLRSQPAVVAHR